MFSLFFNSFGAIGLLGGAFWIWMLYECLKTGGKSRQQWLWILIFLNAIGAVLYFVIEWLPQHPEFFARFGAQFGIVSRKQRDRLWQAEADAKNIGKAAQFVTLGNLLFDMKERDRARNAYARALELEPKNAKALWGAAQVAAERKDYAAAKDYLATLLEVNPEFSYGDASLGYGEMLYHLKEYEAAADHLATHIKSWSSPPAYLMLAKIQADGQEPEAARETLETMILKIKGFVPFQYRKNEHFIRKAQRQLKALPKP